ncbi:MetQ/NlpA family ABC transporter substrate-binding protein [Quadrisphaera sp. KR29]|uniref:MetQ/NlpA family ABC transporter substrate-binding protein n=1 Tax=Quadrisphaera sp. KR29 TaxID=3461391 RepID=UPI0040448538
MSANSTPTPQPEHSDQQPSDLRAAVAARGKRRRNGVIAAVVGALAVAGVATGVAVASTSGGSAEAAGAAAGGDAPAERYSLDLAVAEDTQFQDAIKEVAAEKGLDLTWTNVDDWVLPNTELVAGTVDGNAFQHVLYLSAFNRENGADITPVFSTVITQWGIFSSTLDDVAAIPDGGRVAIPDDPSNGGRALGILEAAGLLEVDDAAGVFPTTEDITANPKGLQFVEVPARNIPQNFDDPSLSAVVVGTSYFDPSQGVTKDDALYLDDSLAQKNLPYVNVVATTADKADDPAWKVLEEAYADPRVEEALDAENFGNTVLVDVPVQELRDTLADLEAQGAAA